jgi:tetratricopeptide (TPR) repeat protein
MKRAAAVLVVGVVVVMVAVCGWAQDASKPTPAAGQAAAAQGKRPPQAKSQPEFDAYKVAAALTDPAAQEKAADDFATKFPDSELRPMLYKSAMRGYGPANNSDKVLAMARKVLSFDADDPEALLAVAQVLTERTHDTDLDKDDRLAEARKSAERALVTVDTDVPTAGQPADRMEAYKNFIRSEAYEILGTLDFNAKAWADAEKNLKKSIDVFPQQPDPVAVFRTAVSLDMQNKYPEAQKYANQAVELTKEGTPAGDAARKERDRLAQLVGGSAPAKN